MNGFAESNPFGKSASLVRALSINHQYTKNDLVPIIGVKNIQALRRGVFHASGSDAVILFICLNKREDATQYNDSLCGNYLFWEGQNTQRTAEKYIGENGRLLADFFVFVQEYTKQPYTYYGRAIPYKINLSTRLGIPSKIEYLLVEYNNSISVSYSINNADSVAESENFGTLDTEATRLTKIRTKQGKYRQEALKLWDNQCAVTGVSENSWLVASHIKPWRVANAEQRIDRFNSLVLTPNFDKLFDRGIISFSPSDGRIIFPEDKDMERNLEKMGIFGDCRLRFVPEKTIDYLKFHNDRVFGFNLIGEVSESDLLDEIVAKSAL